jgi:putative restriction endonuclease
MASNDSTCCITGTSRPELLLASHFLPVTDAPKQRLNPTNGLLQNALHDRAFKSDFLWSQWSTKSVSTPLCRKKIRTLPSFKLFMVRKLNAPSASFPIPNGWLCGRV